MSEVEWERRGHVALVVLNAPERRNAFTVAMADELIAVCDQIDRSDDVGAVVLTGAGGHFCAGAHRELLSAAGMDPSSPDGYTRTGKVYDAVVRIGNLAPPTISAVHGAAVGAGLNLMLATDLRIVAEDARLLAGFLRIGLHPGGGHFALMGRTAKYETVAALSLFGEEISGFKAQLLGLAWEAVPSTEVTQRALALAEKAAEDPQLARMVVASCRAELGPPGVPWPLAVQVERAPQMWSLRRRGPTSAALP